MRRRRGSKDLEKGSKMPLFNRAKLERQAHVFFKSCFDQVDCSSLVFFRILWGCIMALECYRYIEGGYRKLHLVVGPTLNFNYEGFEWVVPWDNIYVEKLQVVIVFACAVGITIGLFYKVCACIFFVVFTHLWMQEASNYLNHIYLVSVMSLLSIILPSNRYFSVDSIIWPKIRSRTVPRWTVLTLRYYICLVYFYASVAKMNEDWLIRAEPLKHWLPPRHHTVFALGFLLTHRWVAYFFSWSGFLIDLLATPLLLYKPLIIYGTAITYLFHSMNKIIFNIGIFPWVMMASQTIFFVPHWPFNLVHFFGFGKKFTPAREVKFTGRLSNNQKILLVILAVFFIQQTYMPLRHHLIPGNVAWSEEGHQYSWRMKLRDKAARTIFYVNSTSHPELKYFPLKRLLTRRQYTKMNGRPYLIWQTAKFIADDIEKDTGERPSVFAKTVCVLNFRWPMQFLIDPSYDLASFKKYPTPAPFITRMGDKRFIPVPGEDIRVDQMIQEVKQNSLKRLNPLEHIGNKAKKRREKVSQLWEKSKTDGTQ